MIANVSQPLGRDRPCSAWRRRHAADVIADWNEKAVAFVLSRGMGPPPAERAIAMIHAAMFDAVNSIERKYRPYLVQLADRARAPRRRQLRLPPPARCSARWLRRRRPS